MIQKILSGLVVSVFCLSLAACSAGSIGSNPPPAGSALSKVKLKMNDNDVRRILGNPSETRPYMTGKSWIPFYWGPDTHRTDWIYKNKGRVVFSRNRYSGGLKVIKVSHEPKIK